LTFESGSNLTRIEGAVFRGFLIELIFHFSITHNNYWIGSSLTSMVTITVEDGPSHFRFPGDFLTEVDGIPVVRYFGFDQSIALSRDIDLS
jgi:hypothetical protein